ncbi:PRO41 protein [Purpureocillium lavendulum]|uniref:PRO41 protein n=1 Tax=Purpureocillium lavendulum TaxID=1247861 RepID=A0AB34G4K8_9HYPO|nr:PRO41 protein [Purpureocillium lavendulum]
MQLSSLLLAVLPSVAMAATAYDAPAALKAVAKDPTNECKLPVSFHVINFAGKKNESSDLSEYHFKYRNTNTNLTTTCNWDTESKSTTPNGLTPRFACADSNVKFIWEGTKKRLTLVERVCPNTRGVPAYEVAGVAEIPLACGSSGCVSNQTDTLALFTSLNPVTDPTHRRDNVVRRHRARGVAWSYEI